MRRSAAAPATDDAWLHGCSSAPPARADSVVITIAGDSDGDCLGAPSPSAPPLPPHHAADYPSAASLWYAHTAAQPQGASPTRASASFVTPQQQQLGDGGDADAAGARQMPGVGVRARRRGTCSDLPPTGPPPPPLGGTPPTAQHPLAQLLQEQQQQQEQQRQQQQEQQREQHQEGGAATVAAAAVWAASAAAAAGVGASDGGDGGCCVTREWQPPIITEAASMPVQAAGGRGAAAPLRPARASGGGLAALRAWPSLPAYPWGPGDGGRRTTAGSGGGAVSGGGAAGSLAGGAAGRRALRTSMEVTPLPASVRRRLGREYGRARTRELRSWADLQSWLVPYGRARHWPLWTLTFTSLILVTFAFMAGQYQTWLVTQGHTPGGKEWFQAVMSLSAGPSTLWPWLAFWNGLTSGADPAYSFGFDYLLLWGGKYNPSVSGGQWWRWVASIIIHQNFLHLLTNLALFLFLSGYLEMYYGTLRITAIFVMSGVAGNFSSTLFEDRCQLVVGASGAIFGLVGLFIADVCLNYESLVLPWLRLGAALGLLVLSVVLQVSDVLVSANVSYASHVGGGLTGLFAAMLFLPNLMDRRWRALEKLASKMNVVPQLQLLLSKAEADAAGGGGGGAEAAAGDGCVDALPGGAGGCVDAAGAVEVELTSGGGGGGGGHEGRSTPAGERQAGEQRAAAAAAAADKGREEGGAPPPPLATPLHPPPPPRAAARLSFGGRFGLSFAAAGASPGAQAQASPHGPHGAACSTTADGAPLTACTPEYAPRCRPAGDTGGRLCCGDEGGPLQGGGSGQECAPPGRGRGSSGGQRDGSGAGGADAGPCSHSAEPTPRLRESVSAPSLPPLLRRRPGSLLGAMDGAASAAGASGGGAGGGENEGKWGGGGDDGGGGGRGCAGAGSLPLHLSVSLLPMEEEPHIPVVPGAPTPRRGGGDAGGGVAEGPGGGVEGPGGGGGVGRLQGRWRRWWRPSSGGGAPERAARVRGQRGSTGGGAGGAGGSEGGASVQSVWRRHRGVWAVVTACSVLFLLLVLLVQPLVIYLDVFPGLSQRVPFSAAASQSCRAHMSDTEEPAPEEAVEDYGAEEFEGGQTVEKSAPGAAGKSDYGDDDFDKEVEGQPKAEEAAASQPAAAAATPAPASTAPPPAAAAAAATAPLAAAAEALAAATAVSPARAAKKAPPPAAAAAAAAPKAPHGAAAAARPRPATMHLNDPAEWASAAAPLVLPPPRRVHMGPCPNNSKFTFSGAPASVANRRPPPIKGDYSHTAYESRHMANQNKALGRKLMDMAKAPTPLEMRARPLLPPGGILMSAGALTRKKREAEIVQGNLAMFRRLQAVKPSPDVARVALERDFVKSLGFGNNARKVKDPGPVTSPPRHTTTATTSTTSGASQRSAAEPAAPAAAPATAPAAAAPQGAAAKPARSSAAPASAAAKPARSPAKATKAAPGAAKTKAAGGAPKAAAKAAAAATAAGVVEDVTAARAIAAKAAATEAADETAAEAAEAAAAHADEDPGAAGGGGEEDAVEEAVVEEDEYEDEFAEDALGGLQGSLAPAPPMVAVV
ncbi:hypothetical protein FOA52_011231 [Chlamydomonas sp. UWO 241]|nr:hypothetical protein FOA52_011231 [Chlamydomonas sp. UWO 241]